LARHKGARSNSTIDHDYPHQVEIEIPDGGLGKRYDAMTALCRAREYPHVTRGIGKLRIQRGRDAMRWCFTDPAHADDFQQQFGGERITARWW
jgi:hypothetical protein